MLPFCDYCVGRRVHVGRGAIVCQHPSVEGLYHEGRGRLASHQAQGEHNAELVQPYVKLG